MSNVLKFVDENLGRFRAEMYDFLRIPSISAESEHDGDMRSAAEWLADRLRDAGLEADIHRHAGHPVVLGEWRGAGDGAPTVLIYGHYDVQPPEPLDEWTSPPFEPTERDGRVYARGSADDKGQLYMHVKALEAHLAATGKLPFNVVVLAEGEEEVGSPNLVPFVKRAPRSAGVRPRPHLRHRDVRRGPALAALLPARPRLLRDLTCGAPRSDLHSGELRGVGDEPGQRAGRDHRLAARRERARRRPRLLRRRHRVGRRDASTRSGRSRTTKRSSARARRPGAGRREGLQPRSSGCGSARRAT